MVNKKSKPNDGPVPLVPKKIVAVYIPNLLWDQDFWRPERYNVMGSNLLAEPPMAQNRRNRSNIIQVTNIPEQYPWDEFYSLLTSFGDVELWDKGSTKPDSTYGVSVTYQTPDEAQQAQRQLNNFELVQGTSLKANFMNHNRNLGQRGNRGNPMAQPQQPFSQTMPAAGRTTEFPLRILVLSDMVGAIIGRGGNTIRQITQQSHARVDVHRKENAGSPEKVITIYGNPTNCSTACQKILDVMQVESNSQGRGEVPLKVLAHNNLIGRIIGRGGSTIKRIMEQSETKITVSTNIRDMNSFNFERVITLKGSVENIGKAEQLVSAKLRQCYENDVMAISSQAVMFPGVNQMSLMPSYGPMAYSQQRQGPPMAPFAAPFMPYPNAISPAAAAADLQNETVIVYIPNSSVGAIIGTGGSSIREMVFASNASIKVAHLPKEESEDKLGERKVTIVATPEGQWKAQYMIFRKVHFDAYNAYSDSMLKVEISVPSNQVGRIIGKGGQMVRELQRMTHATIKVPNGGQNTESEESPVHIIGDFYSSQAAQRQIRALVTKSLYANQRSRSPPQDPAMMIPPLQV